MSGISNAEKLFRQALGELSDKEIVSRRGSVEDVKVCPMLISKHRSCWFSETHDRSRDLWVDPVDNRVSQCHGRYALVLVAVFNAGDFGGRYLPLWKPFYLESRKGILLLCLARGLFVPCFYFAAKYADAGWMIFLCFMLGSTNGWLSVLGFMRAPLGYSVCPFSFSPASFVMAFNWERK